MRRPILVALLLAALAACGGGGGDSSTPTTSSSTTPSSTAVPATSSTASATTTKVDQPVSTEPSGAQLAAGRHPVYLTGVNTAARTITVDLVQVLDRTSAEAATACPEIARGEIDGYCIANASTRLRTLPVSATASLQVLDGRSAALKTVDLGGLAAARRPQKEASFFEITVAAARATGAKELYRP